MNTHCRLRNHTDTPDKQMMKSMGGAGGFEPSASGSSDAPGEDEDEDDDGPPPLEEAEPAKA